LKRGTSIFWRIIGFGIRAKMELLVELMCRVHTKVLKYKYLFYVYKEGFVMKRNGARRVTFFGLLAAVMLIIAAAAAMAQPASAASKKPTCSKNWTIWLTSRTLDYDSSSYAKGYIYVKNLASNGKIYSIKSSNKKYAASVPPKPSMVYTGYKGKNAILVEQINPDSAKAGDKITVSFKVKQNKKVYKFSVKVTVKNAPNPFKAIKVGTSNFTSGFNKGVTENQFVMPAVSKAPIKIAMKPGYKLKSIQVVYNSGKYKTVKNRSTISLKNLFYIEIYYLLPKQHKSDLKKWRTEGTISLHAE